MKKRGKLPKLPPPPPGMKVVDALIDPRTGNFLAYLVRSKVEDIERSAAALQAALQKAYAAGHLVRPGPPRAADGRDELGFRPPLGTLPGDRPKRGSENVGQKPAQKRGRRRPPGKGRL